jgi:hypothetical protein
MEAPHLGNMYSESSHQWSGSLPKQSLLWWLRQEPVKYPPMPRTPSLTLLTSCFALEAKGSSQDIDHLDFKIGVEPKDSPPFTVILVASSRQEKAAWTSDISQVSSFICS